MVSSFRIIPRALSYAAPDTVAAMLRPSVPKLLSQTVDVELAPVLHDLSVRHPKSVHIYEA